jgi:hypothetical protein
VTGSAPFSPDFPTTVGAIERTLAAGGAFVTRLISTGMGLVYSTFLGGGSASGIALDAAGNAYVTGQVSSASSGFPTTPGAYNQNLSTVEVAIFAAKIAPGPPACEVAGLSAGPPAQLKVAVHADRGLSTLAVTSASNATVALPSLTPGTTNTLQISATKINQTLGSTVTLKATDAAGTGATCDPAIVTVGRGPGERPVQVLDHVALGESHLTLVNGRPGVDRLRIQVNGHEFKLTDLVGRPDPNAGSLLSHAARSQEHRGGGRPRTAGQQRHGHGQRRVTSS